MRHRFWVPGLTLSLASFVLGTALVPGQDAEGVKPPTVAELKAALRTPIETKRFNRPMAFNDALELVQQSLAAQGKRLPIRIDLQAFRELNPENQDVRDEQVQLKARADRLAAEVILRSLMSGFTQNKEATMVVRPGCVEISPRRRPG